MAISIMTSNIIQEINKKYDEGMSLRQLADQYYVNHATISAYIWNPRPSKSNYKKQSTITEETKQEINRLYNQGNSIRKVAELMGMVRCTVANYVLEPRQRGRS